MAGHGTKCLRTSTWRKYKVIGKTMKPVHDFDLAISMFSNLENQLKNCLEYVPLIEENRNTVSPRFIPIIIESCSMIDSIFNRLSETKDNKQSFKAYSREFEPYLNLESRISLFLGPPVMPLRPFKEWTTRPTEWWESYNKLKHDRMRNYRAATLFNSIFALAGLHQVMASFKDFVGSFLKAGWINTSDDEVTIEIGSVWGLSSLHPAPPTMLVESSLFVSPSRDNFVKGIIGLTNPSLCAILKA